MSNLTECKDCGHLVSKKAKVCPNCGVGKPSKTSSTFGQILVLVIILWVGTDIIIDQLEKSGSASVSSSPAQTTSGRKLRLYTDAAIQETIAQSDDYDRYRAAFTEAASSLLTSQRCGRREMTQYGGFVKAQGNKKTLPVYFTYCGGSNVDNRIYLDVSTGEIFE